MNALTKISRKLGTPARIHGAPRGARVRQASGGKAERGALMVVRRRALVFRQENTRTDSISKKSSSRSNC